MFEASKLKGESLWALGGGRYIGVDRGSGETHTECEVQRNADGTITVLDVRSYPIAPKEGQADG